MPTSRVDGTRALEVQGLSKRFGTKEVLIDISFMVKPGETICILGPSGSGKSTLLRCINWLERPDRGEILLYGTRVGYKPGTNAGREVLMSDRELARVRARIGMVFQHFNLWPHLTVLGNIIESPVHVLGRPKAKAIHEAERLLDKVGLTEKRNAFPSRLSGGEKQRVGIARALAMRPDLLLFDEPTSSLDPELVGEVLSVMRNLAHEGLTMLVVTHEMKFAREAASRVVFIDKGRIVETGAPDQFFDRPTTERASHFLERYS